MGTFLADGVKTAPVRNLVIVLGDQLNEDSAAFDAFEPDRDAVWMAEVSEECRHVPSHKARIALFFSAMRHFAEALKQRGFSVVYHRFEDGKYETLAAALAAAVDRLRPQRLVMVRAGEYRVQTSLERVAKEKAIAIDRREDRYFWLSHEEFDRWAKGKAVLRCETLYHWMRKRTGLLMEAGKPVGGRWNFDRENRKTFRSNAPEAPRPAAFAHDSITREVLALVGAAFPNHPGRLDGFDWPVTRTQALNALTDFVDGRLANFGAYQDAMWRGEAYLFHSRLSAALNLKLISPREAVDAAVEAHAAGKAPLASVEGFMRQLLGWREFVHGVYWRFIPEYVELNELKARRPLPSFYWTAETDMACLAEVIGQTLTFGYAHHIQRLMVTGLFALLLGVEPKQVHQWYLSIYVDAVEWVEAPNTLGMSQYADGGLVASKPYVASGRYVQRMSNYCRVCRYRPSEALGPRACPFTTLYWDFLMRHEGRFQNHPRAAMQWRQLSRLDVATRKAIARQAKPLAQSLCR